jgi:MoaA/NifB/PqqE/SkfB family radical SAM enzyme
MPKMDDLNINLFLEYTKCDMNCPYCYVKETRKDVSSEIETYMRRIIPALLSLKYRLTVAVEQNGDALISNKIIQFIIELSKLPNMRAVNFNTNLSSSLDELGEFIKNVNTETLTLCCTYHQHVYKDYEGFKEKLRLLKKAGVATVVIMVAYPKGMEKFAQYKKDFNDIGTPLNINAFGGKYKGKIYPYAYSDSEKKFLREIFYSEAAYEYNLERKKTNGIPCTSGVKSIAINRKGDVFACRQDWMGEKDNEANGFYGYLCRKADSLLKTVFRRNRLGNILTGFRLLESHKCPHKICNCARDFHTTVDFVSKYEKTKNLRIYSSKAMS